MTFSLCFLYFSNYDYSQFAKNAEEQTDMSEEDKLLLESYTLSIEEEKIDQNLTLCLVERISASQEDGKNLLQLLWIININFYLFM